MPASHQTLEGEDGAEWPGEMGFCPGGGLFGSGSLPAMPCSRDDDEGYPAGLVTDSDRL